MGELAVRRADPARAGILAELGRRHLQRWSGSPSGFLTEAHVAADFARPGTDLDNDFWSVDLDGQAASFAVLFAAAPFTELIVMLFTDPDLSAADALAVGRANLSAAFRASAPYAGQAAPEAEPLLVLQLWPGEPMVEVAQAYGFEHARSTFTMGRSLGEQGTAPEPPAGVVTRPVDVDRDLDAVTSVLQAFEDHHGDLVFDAEQVRHSLTAPHARPELGRLAEDELGPCAVVLSAVEPSDMAGSVDGYVEALATLRRARGRGIATALLHETFAVLRDAGCGVVRLNVDAQNTTGALALYERAGMTREGELQLWTVRIPASPGPAEPT